MASPINTILFDLDDTLVVEEASAEAAFIETGELARQRYGIDPQALHRTLRQACREIWYGFPLHPYCKKVGISSWEGLWAEFLGPAPELDPLRAWAPAYRIESWRTALRRHGVEDPELTAELAEAFPRLRRERHIVYADAIPVLETLGRHYFLGLVTNGASDLQRRKIEGAGIGGFFREMLISGDIGFGKPDPRVFALILSRIRTSPQAALMIGNNPETDVAAAQRAGLRAVWLNREGAPEIGGCSPDWEIAGLNELPRILGISGA